MANDAATITSAISAHIYEVRPRNARIIAQWLRQWTRSSAYRVSNERNAPSTVDPIPTIPFSTLGPRSAIHNPLRSDNCGRRVAVALLGCAAQYFIISPLAWSGVLICSVSTNSNNAAQPDGRWSKFYHEAGNVIGTHEYKGEFREVVKFRSHRVAFFRYKSPLSFPCRCKTRPFTK
jgi:hypothetical protein